MHKNPTEQKKFFAFIKSQREHHVPLTSETRYYQNLYNDFGLGKFFPSWNWSVFFLALVGVEHYWFFYRRMYMFGSVWYVLKSLLLGTLFLAAYHLGVFQVKIIISLLKMAITLGLGVYANALYFAFLKRKIKKKNIVLPVSGTNWVAPLILILAELTIVLTVFVFIKFSSPEIKELMENPQIKELMNTPEGSKGIFRKLFV